MISMSRRRLASAVSLVAVVATMSIWEGRIAAHVPRAASANRAALKTWTPPRTPWGDPDLQGNYSNKYELGTPFERPEEFKGRRIDEIKGDELSRILRWRQERALLAYAFGDSDPQGGPPNQFGDRFEITKGTSLWFVVDPPEGNIPPMTPEARRRRQPRRASSFGNGPFDGPEDLSLYDRCITRGLPSSMMPASYGNSYQILQGPGYVAIRYEMVHETRVIPLDGRPRLGSAIRQFMGDARGHWDGDALVVETTNFRSDSAYRGANSEALRLIERFRRTAPDKIEWSVTVDDPTTWTSRWTFAMPLTKDDRERPLEYACHEGNYGMRAILSGARAEEKAAERAADKAVN